MMDSGGGGAAHARHGAAPAAAGRFAREMDAAMGRMMRDMHVHPPLGDPDRDFLAAMIPHHEGAMAMAHLALVHGRDALVRELAGSILAGQAVEIEAMQARLAALTAVHGPEYPALTGMRGD